MRNLLHFVVAVSFGFLFGLPANAIENGITTFESPYVVPIYIETNPGATTCGGAAISSKIVVTAAHCLFDKQMKLSQGIRIGNPGSSYEFTESNISKWVPADKVIVHPKFTKLNGSNDSFDIAFIKLASDLVGVESIRIANETETSLNSLPREISVFGYGKIGESGEWPEFPNELRGEIVRPYNSFEFLVSSEMQRICDGDSGSPVYIRQNNSYKLLGVVSRSGGSGNCGTYDFVSTKIRPFLSFAKELGYVEDSLLEEKVFKLQNLMTDIRSNYDKYSAKYLNLAPQLMEILDRDKTWKLFVENEEIFIEIEDTLYLEGDTSLNIDDTLNILRKIEKIQLAAIKQWNRKMPKFQCLNGRTGAFALVNKSKCPKSFTRVRI